MKKTTLSVLAGAALLASAAMASAVAITPGNLITYRVGSGTGTLVNTGNPVFLDEYTPAGSLVQSFATGIFASGTATNEGMLTRSTDGKYIVFTGYASTGTTNISTINAGQNIARVVGRMDVFGTVQIQSLTGDTYFSGHAPRTAASVDGSGIWVGGSSAGVRYTTWGSNSSIQVNPTGGLANIRTLSIYGGQLYGTSQSTVSGTPNRVYAVGTGLPTGVGTGAISLLPGIPGATTSGANTSPNQIALFDLDGSPGLDTLYVADDGTGTGTAAPGIQKWSLVSGNWVYNGSFGAPSVRGLTAVDTGAGIRLYGATGASAAAGGGALYSFLDTNGFNTFAAGSASSIASATTNTAFRGVALAPIPEPAALGLLAPAAMFLARRKRA